MTKTYTLAVNVFNGGDRFVETLNSIEKVHTHFDVIYISITETENSYVDFANCKKTKIPNLRINKYSKPGCKNHFINTIQNLETEFVLFLGHDDICHAEGIVEAINILNSSNGKTCIYGSNVISYNLQINKQILIKDNDFVDSDLFAISRIENEFYLNVSGIFNSVKALHDCIPLMNLNTESYWLDMIAITTPSTSFISQTKSPITTINMHGDQMSNNVQDFNAYCKDGIWYHLCMYMNSNSRKYRVKYLEEIERIGSYIAQSSYLKYLIILFWKIIFSKKLIYNNINHFLIFYSNIYYHYTYNSVKYFLCSKFPLKNSIKLL
jgi:hypothetical protein